MITKIHRSRFLLSLTRESGGDAVKLPSMNLFIQARLEWGKQLFANQFFYEYDIDFQRIICSPLPMLDTG